MKPLSKYNGGDDSRFAQVKYWQDVGGYGISPEMLSMVGFWSDSLMKRISDNGVDIHQSIHQIYGGTLKFAVLQSREWERRYSKVVNLLNLILQVRRKEEKLYNMIPDILNQKWHRNDESILPFDLDPEIKERIIGDTRPTYIVASNPVLARQLLQSRSILEANIKTPAYYDGIYTEAKTVFDRMYLESSRLSMDYLALRDIPRAQTVSIEEIADISANSIIEGGRY